MVEIRKVLSFYEVPSMSHLFVIKKLLLTFEKTWTGTHHWFSSSFNLFLPRTWSYDSEPHVLLDSLHKNEFKQQGLVPLQMWVIWFIFINWNLTTFGNPFHKGNRIFPYFAKSNKMTSFHAIKACNNRLFRLNNRLFYWQFWKFLWKIILLVLWIKT